MSCHACWASEGCTFCGECLPKDDLVDTFSKLENNRYPDPVLGQSYLDFDIDSVETSKSKQP